MGPPPTPGGPVAFQMTLRGSARILRLMKLSAQADHGLDLATLKKHIDARVAHYRARYPKFDPTDLYSWLDERHARASYRGGTADIELGERTVRVELDLPFFARIYRERIETFLRDEIAEVARP